MRIPWVLLIVGLSIVGPQAFAQNHVLSPTVSDSGPSFPKIVWPRPFIYGGLGLNGGGYSPASGNVGAGLRIDQNHLIWEASASYDNAHKSDDNTTDNLKGHDRGIESSAYYRFTDGWFLGAGAGWSQLSTTNYSKQAFHPSIGGGKDYFHKECAAEDCVAQWSMRLQVDYKLPGAEHVDAKGCSVPDGQCTNDEQGPMFSFYLPSPAASGHLFWRETVGVYTLHQTITSTDPALTAVQKSQRSIAPFLEFTMMYRF
ncbi:MAG: hypothetical protein WBQ68_08160 [Terriglobales bacterium]